MQTFVLGFSDHRTWFGTVGNSSVVNAKDDQQGIKAIFKKAVKFRDENHLALLHGSLANFTTFLKDSVLAYTFMTSNPQFVIVINFGSNAETVNLSALGGNEGEVKLSTASSKKGGVTMEKVKVTAQDALVIKIKKQKGLDKQPTVVVIHMVDLCYELLIVYF